MFSSDDTIVAIATPPGRGGLGVVRISGSEAPALASGIITRRQTLHPREATFTRVRCLDSLRAVGVGDDVVVTWFPAPRSYTGEHVIEISAHGSPVILRGIVDALVSAGGRLARPGEFTLRAYLNGRLDLVQAEAIGDLIEAVTPLQARVAYDQLEGTLSGRVKIVRDQVLELAARLEASLDFPDEGFRFIEPETVSERIEGMIAELDAVLSHAVRGRVIRDGATVVIVGRTNVGKSSLFNALVGQQRAIVTDVPGTTRDLVTEHVDLLGLSITLVDTAGLRVSGDTVEVEGIARATRARDASDLLLVVLDSSEPLCAEDLELLDASGAATRIFVASKADRPPMWNRDDVLRISTLTNAGLEELRGAIVHALSGTEARQDVAAISNLRHLTLLRETRATLARVQDAINEDAAPEEVILVDLHRVRSTLGEVLGVETSDEILAEIFERFCVGK